MVIKWCYRTRRDRSATCHPLENKDGPQTLWALPRARTGAAQVEAYKEAGKQLEAAACKFRAEKEVTTNSQCRIVKRKQGGTPSNLLHRSS